MAPGPGVLAFGAVVILSMLATMAFDPRLIWDAQSSPKTLETCLEPESTQ
jgi:paraquat-inducible protein A